MPISFPPSRQRRRRPAGFTLIELLIVIVILGLLTSLVGPRLFGHVSASKVKTTRAQIELIGSALDAYRLDIGRYPTTEEGLAALWDRPAGERPGSEAWRGPYLKKRVDKDPWKNAYAYAAPGQHSEYDLSSLGADGMPGGDGEDADINSWE